MAMTVSLISLARDVRLSPSQPLHHSSLTRTLHELSHAINPISSTMIPLKWESSAAPCLPCVSMSGTTFGPCLASDAHEGPLQPMLRAKDMILALIVIPWARAVMSTPPKARAVAPLDFESSNDMTWPGGNTVVGQVERVERPSYDVHNNPEGLPDSRPLESDTDISKQVSSVKMTILCVALSAFVCLLCVPSHTVMTLLSMLGVGGGRGGDARA